MKVYIVFLRGEYLLGAYDSEEKARAFIASCAHPETYSISVRDVL